MVLRLCGRVPVAVAKELAARALEVDQQIIDLITRSGGGLGRNCKRSAGGGQYHRGNAYQVAQSRHASFAPPQHDAHSALASEPSSDRCAPNHRCIAVSESKSEVLKIIWPP